MNEIKKEDHESAPQSNEPYSFDKAWLVAHAMLEGKDAAITARQEAAKNKSLNPVKILKRLELLDTARRDERHAEEYGDEVASSIEFLERIRLSGDAKKLYATAIEQARKLGDENLANQLAAEIAMSATDLYEKYDHGYHEDDEDDDYDAERHEIARVIEKVAGLMASPKPKDKLIISLPDDLNLAAKTFAVLGYDYKLQPDPTNEFFGEFLWDKPWDKFHKTVNNFVPSAHFDLSNGGQVGVFGSYAPGFQGNYDETSIPARINIAIKKFPPRKTYPTTSK